MLGGCQTESTDYTDLNGLNFQGSSKNKLNTCNFLDIVYTLLIDNYITVKGLMWMAYRMDEKNLSTQENVSGLKDESGQQLKYIDTKRPGNLRLDIGITVFTAVFAVAIRAVYYISVYKYGRTGLPLYNSISYIIILLASSLVFCLLLLILARLLWTIPQKKKQRFLSRILILILMSSFIFLAIKFPLGWSGRKALRNGFLERIERDADIDSIRKWWLQVADRYDVIDYIDKKDWPEAIKQLSPDYIEVGRIVALPKYVTLTWSSFGGTFWGLNVGPKTMECPSPREEDFMQEYYISIGEGAFVYFTFY